MLLYVCQATFRICNTCIWHSGLTTQQSLLLERVQKQTLKILLPEASYDQACAITGLAWLDNRRVELCQRFAMDLINSKALFDWFPPPGDGTATSVTCATMKRFQ